VGDVVGFEPKKKPQYCYTCACGNQTFVLRPDARVECSHCEQIIPQLMWGQYFVSTKGVESGPLPETP
jgi:hypothetical protein